MALRCSMPTQWTTEGRDSGHEMVAEGRESAWICQCGRKAVYGSFEAFQDAIAAADVRFEGETVLYDAPHVGAVEFSWSEPLVVDGKEVPIQGYSRIDNPYCHVDFGTQVYTIEVEGHRVVLDFENGVRTVDEESGEEDRSPTPLSSPP